ncbi:MAG: hypothetical protein ACOVO9_08735, partial [Bacteroidia bacterium]
MKTFKYTGILFVLLIFNLPLFSQDLPFSSTKNKKAEYYFGEALKAFQEGDGMRTLNFVDKAISTDPNFIDAYMLQAEVKSNNEKYGEAMAIYNKVISINPDFPMSYYGSAKINYIQKQYQETLVDCDKFLQFPDHFRKQDEVLKMKSNAAFALYAVKNPVPFEPHNLGPNINSFENEYFPGITADDQTFI